ncbi:hypothetical protein RRG08_041521 [Elysia crispata]|uniref:Uncharacterized protein n=1 Tax=Elysia crispata TaxID=231223 RepID=A0AAE0ZG96_9GAST|nr:hypothetical protein RRG08_041521 [Elysia crispata]
MARIIGSVSPFNETEDTWQAYAERLEHFSLANEIDSEAKKRAVLLSFMSVKPYKLLSNLVAPRKAGECSYTEIVDVLKNHHNPRPSTIVQRFKFNTRVHGASESIRTFVAELKRLSEFCEYNDSLEEMLRDRLVCGINNRRIQQRLLSERSLTFAKALHIAQAMEAAAEGIEDLSGHITDKVCAMKHHRTTAAKPRSTTSDRVCYRCGWPHADSRCRFKDSKCYKRQKIEHIAKVCGSTHTAKVQPKNKHKTHVLDENNVTVQSYMLYSMYSTSAPLCRNLLINSTAVKFQIDTGASLCYDQEDICRESQYSFKAFI